MSKYKPSDVIDSRPLQQREDHFMWPYHIYRGIFGKSEYEQIAQAIVAASQNQGDWVSLTPRQFVPPFDNIRIANYELREWAKGSLLVQRRNRFSLSDEAIERLVEQYPAGKVLDLI